MHPNKILFVIDRISQPGAGTEGQLLLLMHQLHEQGLQLQLLVLNGSPWLAQAKLPWPVRVLGSSSVKNPINWFRLWRLARSWQKEGFSVAQIFFNDASVICPPTFAICGIKTIIARRDMGFWYNNFYRRVLPLTGRFVDGVVVNSGAVGEVTQRVEKLPEDKIHVIYNGYNEVRAKVPSSREHQPELAELKGKDTKIVGLVANIRPVKRIEDAIYALALLADELPNLHLVIVGSGETAPLVEIAQANGIESRVHFLGSRNDISACMSYFDVGVLCSESEGFSNSIVEYQQAALPVVCSRTGGNPEAVTEGENGSLYPVGDIKALAECLLALLVRPEEARRMGENGRRMAEERYDPKTMASRYLQLYRALLRKR